MVFKVIRKITQEKSKEQLEAELELLDDDFCLPKVFYLNSEWVGFICERMRIVSQINKLTGD